MAKNDLTGKRFGRLTVLCMEEHTIGKPVRWKCQCDCGNITFPQTTPLYSGRTKSCGCFKRDLKFKHGYAAKGNRTPEYRAWYHIIQRCGKENSQGYDDYGARGISVCDRWKESYSNFLEDMGERPSPKHSIERLNNDGNYEPSNCKWATTQEQARNRRSKKNKTGTIGVAWYTSKQKYHVQIGVNSKKIHIGYFETLEEAIKARKQAEQKYWKSS